MPFPLAHPAAVLPLRRWCPHRLSFPALVIGSLVPDTGYLLGRYHAAAWSHSFWIGGVCFCVPVGLLLFWIFRKLGPLVVGLMPVHHRQMLGSLLQRAGPPLPVLLGSLLVGGWSHILLDSITHPEGWLVKHSEMLRQPVFRLESTGLEVCDLLYYGLTFVGVAWLTICHLHWLAKARGVTDRTCTARNWAFALGFAAVVSVLCAAVRSAA